MIAPVRRRLAAAALVLLVPALGACGFGYQTDQVYQPGVGSDARSAVVEVLGAVIVSSGSGSGTFVAGLANSSTQDTDSLTSVTAEGAQATLSSPIELQPSSLVSMSDLGAVSVTGERVEPGNFVQVQLTFQSGQKTSLNVPVVDRKDEYADVKMASSSSSSSPSPFSARAMRAASCAGCEDRNRISSLSTTPFFQWLNRLSSSRNMPWLRPVWMLESMR